MRIIHGVRGGPVVGLMLLLRRRKEPIVGRWNGVYGCYSGWMVVLLQVVLEVRRAETLLLLLVVTFVRFHFFREGKI